MLLLIATIGYLGTSPMLASGLTLVIATVLAMWAAVQHWRSRRSKELVA